MGRIIDLPISNDLKEKLILRNILTSDSLLRLYEREVLSLGITVAEFQTVVAASSTRYDFSKLPITVMTSCEDFDKLPGLFYYFESHDGWTIEEVKSDLYASIVRIFILSIVHEDLPPAGLARAVIPDVKVRYIHSTIVDDLYRIGINSVQSLNHATTVLWGQRFIGVDRKIYSIYGRNSRGDFKLSREFLDLARKFGVYE